MTLRFSSFAENLGGEKNALYRLLDDKRAGGAAVVDLVKGNVNEHGIVYPEATLREILADALPATRIYRPDSFGQAVARETVAKYYAELKVGAEQVLLTPGTSVSYWYCFKLLAEPGDEILCPQPSYPLFDYIAKLSGVELTHYPLRESHDWAIDFDQLETQITSRTRATVMISPHNPTGMVADHAQLSSLAEIAGRRQLPIIADEVFSEFLFGVDSLPRPATTEAPLVFTLNGLSKMFALPGMKLGWMVVTGESELVRKSLSALEMISDTFLPVNEAIQFATPQLFRQGRDFRARYVAWVRSCYDAAMKGVEDIEFVRPKGGFYVTIPATGDEEEVATHLLRDHGILTHPGYYYDIAPNHLVMTFIHDPQVLGDVFRKIGSAVRAEG